MCFNSWHCFYDAPPPPVTEGRPPVGEILVPPLVGVCVYVCVYVCVCIRMCVCYANL